MRCRLALFVAGHAALLAACGDSQVSAANSTGGSGSGSGSSPTGGAGATSTVVSLNIQLAAFPWDASAGQADVTKLAVQVGDPAALYAGSEPDVAWQGTATAVTAADCQTVAGSPVCTLTLANVETKDTTVGLAVQTQDTRGSSDGIRWAVITTAMPQKTVESLRGATGAAAFPVGISTNEGTNQLAQWSGISKIDLIGQGAVIGKITDKTGKGVAGAALGGAGAQASVVYANGDFSGHTAAPAASGTPTPWLLAAPTQKGTAITSDAWTVSAGAGAGTWTVPKLSSAANFLVFVALPGN